MLHLPLFDVSAQQAILPPGATCRRDRRKRFVRLWAMLLPYASACRARLRTRPASCKITAAPPSSSLGAAAAHRTLTAGRRSRRGRRAWARRSPLGPGGHGTYRDAPVRRWGAAPSPLARPLSAHSRMSRIAARTHARPRASSPACALDAARGRREPRRGRVRRGGARGGARLRVRHARALVGAPRHHRFYSCGRGTWRARRAAARVTRALDAARGRREPRRGRARRDGARGGALGRSGGGGGGVSAAGGVDLASPQA